MSVRIKRCKLGNQIVVPAIGCIRGHSTQALFSPPPGRCPVVLQRREHAAQPASHTDGWCAFGTSLIPGLADALARSLHVPVVDLGCLHALSTRATGLNDKRGPRQTFVLFRSYPGDHPVVGAPQLGRDLTRHITSLGIVETHKRIICQNSFGVRPFLRSIPASF